MENYPLTLTDYEDCNRPQNQQCINNIAVNPALRPDFDATDYNDRDPEEIRDWWERPYIVTITWQDIEMKLKRNANYVKKNCLNEYFNPHIQIDKQYREALDDWSSVYPKGVRYEVRCLDGCIPDRSTVWGNTSTLEEALQLAAKGPPWALKNFLLQ